MIDKKFNLNFADFVRDRLESINYGGDDPKAKEFSEQYHNIINELRRIVGFELVNSLNKIAWNTKGLQMEIAYQLGFSDAMKLRSLDFPKQSVLTNEMDDLLEKYLESHSRFHFAIKNGFLWYSLNEIPLKNCFWNWCLQNQLPCCTILKKQDADTSIEIDFITCRHRLTDTEIVKLSKKVAGIVEQGYKANKINENGCYVCVADLILIDGVKKAFAEEIAKKLNEIVASVLTDGIPVDTSQTEKV